MNYHDYHLTLFRSHLFKFLSNVGSISFKFLSCWGTVSQVYVRSKPSLFYLFALGPLRQGDTYTLGHRKWDVFPLSSNFNCCKNFCIVRASLWSHHYDQEVLHEVYSYCPEAPNGRVKYVAHRASCSDIGYRKYYQMSLTDGYFSQPVLTFGLTIRGSFLLNNDFLFSATVCLHFPKAAL